MSKSISFPEENEYAEFYTPYIQPLAENSFFELLSEQKSVWLNEIHLIDESKKSWGLRKW